MNDWKEAGVMMISRRPRWTVVVTHLPTGIEVVRTSDHFRQQRMARDAAMKYLRSKLWSLGLWLKEEDLKVEEVSNEST